MMKHLFLLLALFPGLLLSQAPNSTQPASAAARENEPILEPEKKALETQIRNFRDAEERARRSYFRWFSALTISGFVISLLGGIAGFLKKATMAGILSMIVASLIAFQKYADLGKYIDFERVLATQGDALLSDVYLTRKMTDGEHEKAKQKLQLLFDYKRDNFPKSGDVGQTTQQLIEKLDKIQKGI